MADATDVSSLSVIVGQHTTEIKNLCERLDRHEEHQATALQGITSSLNELRKNDSTQKDWLIGVLVMGIFTLISIWIK